MEQRQPDMPQDLHITIPPWVIETFDFEQPYGDDHARMAVAVDAARENVRHGTGGPFGAAVFEMQSGRLIAVGTNRVVPLNNCVLHAEILALMLAQARLGTYTLGGGPVEYELFTSCEPCAMCLGAIPWSGVRRVVWAATREDAGSLQFDEGPVFDASYGYLEARGLQFEQGLLRADARAVLEDYARRGGRIYNG